MAKYTNLRVEPDLLQVCNITKDFDTQRVLEHIDLSVKRGEVHALLGGNGAGKTTLVRIICGSICPSLGEIIYDGKTHEKLTPDEALRLGIIAVHQECKLIDSMTVAENLYIGSKGMGVFFYAKKSLVNKAERILDSLHIDVKADEDVSLLNVSQRLFVSIARAVAQNVRLLILDEPTAMLTKEETDKLFEIIRTLKKQRVSIIYISHRLEEIREISDRVTILRDGNMVFTGNARCITTDEMIMHMTDKKITDIYPAYSAASSDEILSVEGICGKIINNVDFRLYKGEILGISGLEGAGKSTLLRLIYGAEKKEGGNIYLEGALVNVHSPADAIRIGIGYVPADRRREAIMGDRSVRDNILLANLKKVSSFSFVNANREKKLCTDIAEALNIKCASVEQDAGTLSGGNQQKISLGRWLEGDFKILLLDEPTQGMDVKAKREIYGILRELASSGTSIIIASSDYGELVGMSDRILTLYEGRSESVECRGKSFTSSGLLTIASGRERKWAAG